MNGAFVFFYRLLHPVVSWIRSRPVTFRVLFGLKVPVGVPIHYDTTTVLLRKALEKEVKTTDRVLEMGIGQAALLSLFIAKKKKMIPSGVDLSQARVDSSVATARLNAITAKFWASDLFTKVDGTFDVIFFNPPYVDTESGRKLNLSKRLSLESDAAWDGGVGGTDIIKKFVVGSARHLVAGGKVIVGVQDFYIRKETIERIAGEAGYYIHDVIAGSLNPSKVYVLKKQQESK